MNQQVSLQPSLAQTKTKWNEMETLLLSIYRYCSEANSGPYKHGRFFISCTAPHYRWSWNWFLQCVKKKVAGESCWIVRLYNTSGTLASEISAWQNKCLSVRHLKDKSIIRDTGGGHICHLSEEESVCLLGKWIIHLCMPKLAVSEPPCKMVFAQDVSCIPHLGSSRPEPFIHRLV